MDPDSGIPVSISRTCSGIVPFQKLEIVPECVPETRKIPVHIPVHIPQMRNQKECNCKYGNLANMANKVIRFNF